MLWLLHLCFLLMRLCFGTTGLTPRLTLAAVLLHLLLCLPQSKAYNSLNFLLSQRAKLLTCSHPITCPLDPISTNFLQSKSPTMVSAITQVTNTSLASGTFPAAFKRARVTPLLKNPSLNPAQVGKYRLCTSYLITERAIFKHF